MNREDEDEEAYKKERYERMSRRVFTIYSNHKCVFRAQGTVLTDWLTKCVAPQILGADSEGGNFAIELRIEKEEA